MKTVSKIFVLLFSTAVAASCQDDDSNTTAAKSPIVLVHGAWQCPYVWDKSKTDLEAAGFQVSVVELPAHGNDQTPAHQVSLQGYVDVVKTAINAFDKPVILVGHSLGGAVITQTATQLPTKISKLVYVAGFIPQSGKSVLDLSQMDSQSLLPPAIRLSEDQTLALIDNPSANLAPIFAQDATDAQKQFLLEKYRPEPTIPFGTPLSYTSEEYASAGKKFYIYTTDDKAITYGFQQQMAEAAGIENTYAIAAGHSPFVSRPAELVEILKKIAKK